jgi:hypothetical protein
MWDDRYDTLERTTIDWTIDEIKALRADNRTLRERISQLEGELWRARIFAMPGIAQIAPAKARYGPTDGPRANARHAAAEENSHARPTN